MAPAAAKKSEEVPVGTLKVVYMNCSTESQEFIVNTATKALRPYVKGEVTQYTEIAQTIHSEISQKMKGTWHVIVGKSFGSFVTHEAKRYATQFTIL